MKNEKILLDIQTKRGDIANEILNAAIYAELIFKCQWPHIVGVFIANIVVTIVAVGFKRIKCLIQQSFWVTIDPSETLSPV